MRGSLHPGLLACVLASATGCGGAPPPVASLEVGPPRLDLPHRRYAPLALSWQVQAPLEQREGRLAVFVHLLDESGYVVRSFDHPWPAAWRPGARLEYEINLHHSALAPPLEPGSYDLVIGLQDSADRRWPLEVRGAAVDRYAYRVAEVRVAVETSGDPMYQFSSDWRDSEAGRDLQVLARRRLNGPGYLRCGGIKEPGQLFLRLVILAPSAQQYLVLAEGALQQGAAIRSDCSEVEVQLAGPGSHDVLLPLQPGGGDAGDSCRIAIEPNFYLHERDSLKKSAVSLDVLAWGPRES